jgi:hypothetical protein
MRSFAVVRVLVLDLLIAFISQVVLARSSPPPMSATPVRDAQAVALLQQCSQAMGTPSANSGILAFGQVNSAQLPRNPGKLTIENPAIRKQVCEILEDREIVFNEWAKRRRVQI